jgi:hypothetical protein
MAAPKEKLDFLTRTRIRELVLMGLITLTALLANLPRDYVEENLGMDPTTLLAVLAIAIIFGLFFYLKFFFFVAVVLLIAGANMPEQIAEGLNVSRIPIILALLALIGVGAINSVVKLLPTGLEPRPKEKSPEGIRALFYAIEKNNLAYAKKVLAMNFDPNLEHDNGYTPLGYAAMKGNPAMAELLLRHGADAGVTTREGDTPVELALRMGHAELADLLRKARQANEAAEASADEEEPAPQAG